MPTTANSDTESPAPHLSVNSGPKQEIPPVRRQSITPSPAHTPGSSAPAMMSPTNSLGIQDDIIGPQGAAGLAQSSHGHVKQVRQPCEVIDAAARGGGAAGTSGQLMAPGGWGKGYWGRCHPSPTYDVIVWKPMLSPCLIYDVTKAGPRPLPVTSPQAHVALRRTRK